MENYLFVYKKGDFIKFDLKVYDENKKVIEKYCREKEELVLTENKADLYSNLLIGKNLVNQLTINHKNNDKKDKQFHNKVLTFEINILDYKPAELVELKSNLKELKNNLNIKESSIEILNKKLAHTENQLRLAINDVKKAKESKIIEKFTMPEEELANIKKYALQKFLEEFLEPYSTLKSAISTGENNSNNDVKNYVFGFKMVLSLIDNILNNNGLIEIWPEVNKEFDHFSSKIVELKEDDSLPNNTVIKVNSPGYKLYERVIKPSLVVVTTNKK
ncbi:Heat shock protein GrpE [Mycoplasmopsis meleagridis]|uniref:Protein GrpE n=1 Tax=Mycoplasmopsis meleagridis ATCC 25294 TaxID=1264554 RepID=A0A0F5GZY9_9BACT|nr:nucleotide exchange factor GrpE [Mycoplasmopsis meleagridis]KKB26599.1 Heat shock protein GrpE [Mycoplasmopsis meleagridis ATCC 25294]KUH47424.1 hypothetical protein ASB56_00955 [Mycoplasmopsis meleagridis]OAD18469.1 Heat shock protein GrpE [Mycoplasmopsis meleagridis]VEU77662.1 heat shock protein [Mycoplasmopsis meleagridis]